jgi:hypothetical protein
MYSYFPHWSFVCSAIFEPLILDSSNSPQIAEEPKYGTGPAYHSYSRTLPAGIAADSWIRVWGIPYGNGGGQIGTSTDVSPLISIFPCQYHSTVDLYSFVYHLRMENGHIR